MTQSFQEGVHTNEFLLSYEEEGYSLDQVVIDASAPAMVPGTLLGKITASGKFTAYNNAATDGSQVAIAINCAAVPDLTTDQHATVISRQAEVMASLLTGLDAAGRADLAAVGIIVRD